MKEINYNELKYSVLTEVDIITLHRLKDILIRSQLYEEAAILRNLEKRMIQIIDAAKEQGFPTPRKIEEIGKQNSDVYYSFSEVKKLIDLATTPIKNVLTRYETSMKSLIDLNIRELIIENHKIKERVKLDQEALAEFILYNFAPYNHVFESEPKVSYRRQNDNSTWDGEPTILYTTQEVIAEFLADQRKKQDTQD